MWYFPYVGEVRANPPPQGRPASSSSLSFYLESGLNRANVCAGFSGKSEPRAWKCARFLIISSSGFYIMVSGMAELAPKSGAV